MATLTVYGLKTCDTCRKARKELDAAKIVYAFHDVRDDGVSKAELARWSKQVGWEALLNKSSTTWRALPEAERAGLTEAKALSLMTTHPALIKRPVIVRGQTEVHVGWSPAARKEILG